MHLYSMSVKNGYSMLYVRVKNDCVDVSLNKEKQSRMVLSNLRATAPTSLNPTIGTGTLCLKEEINYFD